MLKPYANDAVAAFDMARRLMSVKRFLQIKPPGVLLVKAASDDACELLFPFTEFRGAAYDLYLIFIEGNAHESAGRPFEKFTDKALD